MNQPPGDGGTYSSIDPDALKAVHTSLQKTVDGIAGLSGFAARFGTGGVSTVHLTKLTSFSSTISALIPELTRRESLARAMVAEHPGQGPIAYFSSDSLGAFATTEAALKQAKDDASKIKDGKIPDDVLANIKKYGLDPDYSEAMLKALGPKGLAPVLVNYNPQGIAEGSDDDQRAVSTLLATASYRVPLDWEHWYKPMVTDLDIRNPLYIMSNFLNNGDQPFSAQALGNLADMRFKQPDSTDGYFLDDPGQEAEQNILQAFSNSPLSAAAYMSKNQDLVYSWMKGDMNVPDTDKAWASFVHAATIDARNLAGTTYLDKPGLNPAILNAEFMMKKVGGDDHEWSDDMTNTLAAMASVYMDSYTRTVGSPIDVGSVKDPRYDGVSVSVADWQAFLKKGMHTDEGVTTIMAAFQQQIAGVREDASNGDQKGMTDAVYWSHYTFGALQRTFQNLYAGEADRRGKSAADMEAGIDNLIDKGLDFALDPQGTLKSLTVDAVKGLLHSAVDIKPDALPGLPSGFDTKGNFAYYAADRLHDADGKFPPVTEKIGGGTTITWDGDTKLYTEPSPPNGDFTDPKFQGGDGKIDVDKVKGDPDAWRAYNEWLHDPAVQNAVSPGFSKDFDGDQEGR